MERKQNVRESTIVKNRTIKEREIILKRYKSILQGELCMPQLQEVRYSSDGREVYRILEMDENGNTIQKYVARIAKKKLRGFKYSIRIEE